MKTKEYFSIPNLMGYFRILLVPVYLYLSYHAESETDYYAAAGVMLLSFLTDFFDGRIARRFNMITEFGKILDPVADKITQGALVLSFVTRYPAVMLLLCLFLGKELIMGVMGIYMMKRNYRMDGASMHGKICTALLDMTMFVLLIFPKLPYMAVNLLTAACIASMLVSFACYMRMYYGEWKRMRGKKERIYEK